jgi:prepilin-type processing-associated H-X9-DG protein
MRIRIPLLVIALSIVFTHAAHAEDRGDAAIAPFMDDQTLVVVRVNLPGVDPQATLEWAAAILKQQNVDQGTIALLRKWWKPPMDRYGEFISQLQKAGAKRVYWMLTLSDLSEEEGLHGVFVAPLEPGADGRAVINLLSTGNPQGSGEKALNARQVGNAVVAAAPDQPEVHGNGQLRTDWAEALAAGDGAPVRVSVVPTMDLRRSFEENMPTFPIGNVPKPVTTLTRGISWVTATFALPPKPQVNVVLKSPDGASAKAITQLTEELIPVLRQQNGKLHRFLPPADELAALLKPTVAGDQVRWNPDPDKLVMPAVARQITQAVHVHSAANMRQIILACLNYGNARKNQWPPDLATAFKDQDISPDVAIDPLHPEEKNGYVYIPPSKVDVGPDRTLAVLYEAWPEGLNVAFADGHVEWFPTRAAVEEQIKAAEAHNKEAAQKK